MSAVADKNGVLFFGWVAQLVEQGTENPCVGGSIPSPATKIQLLKMKTDVTYKFDEMLDVLDENGNKTGEVRSRKAVHTLGLWHRIALLVIANDRNEILLQQRSANVLKFPNLWDLSVASHVQSGQNSLNTLLREVNEEIGFQIPRKITVMDFQFVTSFRNQHTFGDIIENQFYDLFLIRENINLDQITFNDNEVQDVKYMNYTQVQKLMNEGKMHHRKEWITPTIETVNKF